MLSYFIDDPGDTIGLACGILLCAQIESLLFTTNRLLLLLSLQHRRNMTTPPPPIEREDRAELRLGGVRDADWEKSTAN
jgi:hypothetical protein